MQATGLQAYWAGDSFLVAYTVLQPSFTALSSRYSFRIVTLVAVSMFAMGNIVCGIAQSPAVLIAGRTIQGAGGGGILAMTYVMMVDLLSLRDRATALALNSLVWTFGACAGPILGGTFSSHSTWVSH